MVATDAHRIVRSMVDQLAAGATTALSAVDPERAAQEDLHGALYLSYVEMSDIGLSGDWSAGNFEMMNRILDATGVPVSPAMREIAGSLAPR